MGNGGAVSPTPLASPQVVRRSTMQRAYARPESFKLAVALRGFYRGFWGLFMGAQGGSGREASIGWKIENAGSTAKMQSYGASIKRNRSGVKRCSILRDPGGPKFGFVWKKALFGTLNRFYSL